MITERVVQVGLHLEPDCRRRKEDLCLYYIAESGPSGAQNLANVLDDECSLRRGISRSHDA